MVQKLNITVYENHKQPIFNFESFITREILSRENGYKTVGMWSKEYNIKDKTGQIFWFLYCFSGAVLTKSSF